MIKLNGRIMPKRLFGKIRIDYGPYNGTLQSKVVEPSTEDQNVVADEGYNALSLVLVKAATLQEKTVTPSSQIQAVVPDVGVYGLSRVVVEPQGDHGLLEEITVTPTQEVQKIVPSEGYYGIDVVNVEAALLEEVTIYPAYETQTIAPSEGYYGIGSITVEAMEESDPEGDTGGSGTTEDLPDAESVRFGGEYVTKEVPTGVVTKVDSDGESYTLPTLPEECQEDAHFVIMKERVSDEEVKFTLYTNRGKWWLSDGLPVHVSFASIGGVNKYECSMYFGELAETNGSTTGWILVDGDIDTVAIPVPTIWLASATIVDGNGNTITPYDNVIIETENVIYYLPAEREERYSITGDTLNNIAMAIQAITKGSLMTPSAMAAAIDNLGST